jgi:DNA (cytosine-5)-methyltransferase 1
MKIATLFSGIGAPEQGAKRVYGDDFEMAFACEYDKFARQSFEANYDIDPLHFHKDVHDMDGTQYQGKVDVLVGGSPCQAFSIAGLRNGTDDVRGQLIYQYIRIVDEVKAPVIIYENVKGMLSIDGGRTIKEFVQALRDIGYYCHYEVVNTKNYGVPQNRERIFLVGFLDHEAYHRFSFAPKQKLEKRLKDVLEDDVDEKYYLNKPFELYNQQSQGNTLIDIENECNTLIAGTHGYAQGYINDTNRINRTLRIGGGSSMSDKHCFDLVGIDVIGLLDCKGTDQIRRVYGVDGVAATLTTMQGGNQEPKILQLGRGFNNGGEHEVCPTLTKCSFEQNNFVSEKRIRKLTPLECWRLQDFPNEAHNKAKASGVSDSQLYKQAGNSMSVNVLEMIFRQIEKAKSVGSSGSLFDREVA